MPVDGLDHVLVAAPPGCEPEARRFYGSLLGLPELEVPEPLRASGGAWFAAGASELHVGTTEAFSPTRKGHPGFRVDGVDELERLAAVLERAGADVRWDTRLTDRTRFYTDDPWGNRVELLAYSSSS